MQTIILWLQVIPAILRAVIESAHAIEAGFQAVADATGNKTAGVGAQKLALFEDALGAALPKVEGLATDQIVSVAKTIASKAVTVFNSLGWFKKAV